jgi:4-amino-4-deoxy-L-arabinose transferase-like glycosyltransferase
MQRIPIEKRWLAPTLLFLFAFIIIFTALDQRAMQSKAEARNFMVAREMLDSGDWLIPTLDGELRIKKPPLYNWLICFGAKWSGGRVSDFSARLPSAVVALLLVLLIYYWSVSLWEKRIPEAPWWAAVAALLLLACPIFISYARRSEIDMLLAFTTAVASYCFWSAIREREKGIEATGLWLVGYIFVGMAAMTKGPIGILVPLLPLWLPSLTISPIKWRWKSHLIGWAILLAIALPWPLYAVETPGGGGSTFWSEISMRFSSQGKHARPFYFYLGAVFTLFPIISLLMPWAVVRWWKEKRNACDRYLLLHFLASLALFSIFSTKRYYYLLPLLPSQALILTWWMSKSKVQWKTVRSVLWILLTLLALALVVFNILTVSLIPLLMLVSILIGARLTRKQVSPVLIMGLGIICAIELTLMIGVEPRLQFKSGEKPFATAISNKIAGRGELFTLGQVDPVLLSYIHLPHKRISSLDEIKSNPKARCFILAENNLEELDHNPNLVRLMEKPNRKKPRNDFALYALLKDVEDRLSAAMSLGPIRLAVLGNINDKDANRYIGAWLAAPPIFEHPLDAVVFTGELPLFGPPIPMLQVWKGFEDPYKSLLRRGVRFFATTGCGDESRNSAVSSYAPFAMQKKNYKKHTLRSGLCDLFILDSQGLLNEGKKREQQLQWLQESLAESNARWKLAVLAHAPTQFPEIKSLLIPIFEEHGVEAYFAASNSTKETETIFNNGVKGYLFATYGMDIYEINENGILAMTMPIKNDF